MTAPTRSDTLDVQPLVGFESYASKGMDHFHLVAAAERSTGGGGGSGWARTELSDHFVPLLRQQLRLGLGHEDAIELYYNAAITPWLSATLDLQIIEQALERRLDSSGSQIRDLNTAIVLGLRLYARF